MSFEIKIILEWQQRGMNARVLGLSASKNPVAPYLENESCPQERDRWLQNAEAWLFGWNIEDAARATFEPP